MENKTTPAEGKAEVMATFSLSEIRQKNNQKEPWIVINNCVYDVTKFLNEHPGGEEVLLEYAGADGTEAFEDVGHSSDAREMMKKYKIGEVIKSDCKIYRSDSSEGVSDGKKWPWSGGDSSNDNWAVWIVPILLGLAATVLFRYFIY